MKIDDVLQKQLSTLLVVFFNTIQNNMGNFEVHSNYRETKFLELPGDSHEKTAEQLSHKYSLDFENKSESLITATITNNKNWTLSAFLDAIYASILLELNKIATDYPLDSEIALAMFILRGSADFNRGFYAVDLKNPTQQYIENMFKILLSSDDLLSKLNLNFRELQPQHISGERLRNTQIRINLKWFYDHVITRFRHINQYKTDVLVENFESLGEIRNYRSFENRLIFYKQSILGRDLSEKEIEALRRDLDFTKNELELKPENTFSIRNQKIVSYARETLDDICVGCNDKYPISDRSFKMPRNNRYYLEINHVISYANDSTVVDVLDNPVKLCPTCHRALTPGRAYVNLQKDIIKNMISSRVEVEKFILSMMTDTTLNPVDFVSSKLR